MVLIHRSRHIPFDDNGIEGLPLTLIIVMIVLAITVPLVFGSLRAYDRSRIETSLISEIDDFISLVQLVYTSGPGNSVVVDFNVQTGSFVGIDSVTFGDAAGGDMASVIRYIVDDRPEQLIILKNPNVPMMSLDNESFQIPSGSYRIKADCAMGTADLNNDGLSDDTFIILSLVY